MIQAGRIRVVVADDSSSLRSALRALLAHEPRIEVVGEAEDGVAAVDLAIGLRPDVITMDVSMPRLDGLAATSAIMAQAPTRILVVCDAREARHTDLALKAIAAGALDVVPKPTGTERDGLRGWGVRLAETIQLMSAVPVVSRRRQTRNDASPDHASMGGIEAIGIVASTGGPPALAQLVARLPAELPCPVFIAQHMAAGFTHGLVRWLSEVTPLRVTLASEGARARPGHVYVPEDSHHLEVEDGGVMRLARSDDGFHPSGDRLLASMARVYQNRAAGVVLTGMGEDGARGLLAIRDAGGVTMAQELATCVVRGMPAAATALGATRSLLPIDAITQTLGELASKTRRSHMR